MNEQLSTMIKVLYDQFGQRKSMGKPATSTRLPHFFLLRTFKGENDLLVIFNTKRCAYQCFFCMLPAISSKAWIPSEDIIEQFKYVVREVKHALSILDRVTLSNNGSVLDARTFPAEALLSIVQGINELRRVRTLVLETRLEFVNVERLRVLQETAPRVKLNILTGFETLSPYIREKILFKREPLEVFLTGLDHVAEANAELTAYILYKPSQTMSDSEAFIEAEKSIDFLVEQCRKREIPLTIRIGPMYLAAGSKWAEIAHRTPQYMPPKLSDVLKLAEKKSREGVKVFIGLSSEGVGEVGGSYDSREDFSYELLKRVIVFNSKQ